MATKDIADKEDPRILIVEDSPTQAEQLEHILDEHRFIVTIARNGREALEALEREKPSLVLSDIMMPEMDGYELCAKIRSSKNLQDLPVMLVTSLSSPQDIIKSLQCGADSFVRKPYEERYLISRIHHVLANHSLRKNQKVQTGLYIELSGQKHFITAERQQILDMLISSYDEAVNLNDQLTRSYKVLSGLYRIAEDLNKCTSEQEVAERALERALELPGVRAGWMALQKDNGDFYIPAAMGLPPALQFPGALQGDCVCRKKLLDRQLEVATNILECERLMNAQGDTFGLRYHASVPLWVGERRLGILNLASAEGSVFSDDDLKTLNSVGNQVAVALERARLYEHLERMVEERTADLNAEIRVRRRAEEEAKANLDRIRALHDIATAISSTLDLPRLLSILLEKIDLFLTYPLASTIRLLDRASGKLEPAACRNLDEDKWKALGPTSDGRGSQAINSKAPVMISDLRKEPGSGQITDFYADQGLVSYLGLPLIAKDEILGVLSFYTKREHQFSAEEMNFLETLAGQAAIAIHNAQLYEASVIANKVKDEFLSVMSHELRTPLNVVVGYSGMIMDGMLGEINDKQREALGKVITRANDELSIVNNILYATVLETEGIKAETHQVGLADFLDQLHRSYDASPTSTNKEVTLKWDYPSDLPVVETDSAKLRHILQNLIDNAMKFTPKGEVRISVRIPSGVGDQGSGVGAGPRPPAPEPQFVEFKVADTGVGIPKDMQSNIFDKFKQVDSSETRLYGGVGMGLYVARKFTELLGGTIQVESQPGKGSTFTVAIPL